MARSHCSNRTFMELKLALFMVIFLSLLGSNRTFMELKFYQEVEEYPYSKVLIVPLWN